MGELAQAQRLGAASGARTVVVVDVDVYVAVEGLDDNVGNPGSSAAQGDIVVGVDVGVVMEGLEHNVKLPGLVSGTVTHTA